MKKLLAVGALLLFSVAIGLAYLLNDQPDFLIESSDDDRSEQTGSPETEIEVRSGDELERVALAHVDSPAVATRVLTVPGQPMVSAPSLISRYDELAKRAKAGDVDAARQLGVELTTCRHYFDRIQRIGAATSEHRYGQTDADVASELRRAEKYLDQTVETQAMCADLPAELMQESLAWLGLAASLGDAEGAVLYYSNGIRQDNLARLATRPQELLQFRENALRGLSSAARQCYPPAVRLLAWAYLDGVLSPVDRTRALGYHLIYTWVGVGGVEQQFVPERQVEIDAGYDFARRYFDRNCR